ncbi:MAG: XRE family transcriptional regulator [Chlamydiales bacterium]|nr:XRE family transcriptional regulator [Chlamydiales bacterium]
MADVAISPDVFRWATRRAGLANAELAKRMNVKVEKIHDWEAGNTFPTIRQTERLAKALRVPLGYLFLSQPPIMEIPISDFRTLPNKENLFISIDLQEVIYDAQRKSDWYKEWRIEEGLEPYEFVGKYSVDNTIGDVVQDLRRELNIPEGFAGGLHSWSEHLNQLVNRVEDKGILVLQSGIVGNNTHRKLSVNEFRGFSIADDYAPLIFINAQDAITARIFTLVHELTHIWIGEGGISDPDYFKKGHPLKKIETFCNKVAAEFLIPGNLLEKQWNRKIGAIENTETLCRKFFVSQESVLQRAYNLGLISDEDFTETLSYIQSNQNNIKKDGGGNYYRNLITRNSKRFTQDVLYAVRSNRLTYIAAARLLNTQPDKLSKIMEIL